MRILHTSDLHGRYKALLRRLTEDDFDVWIDTGDLQPHPGMGRVGASLAHQPVAQRKWWSFKKLERRVTSALAGRPAILVQGNHDCFGSYPQLLRHAGARVHVVSPEQPVDLLGERFAGFRHVPFMDGRWPAELPQDQLAAVVDEALAHDPSVLLTHAPAFGVLDDQSDALHTGIRALTERLDRGAHRVRLHLFGHIHECGGAEVTRRGIRHVNSATQLRLINLEED